MRSLEREREDEIQKGANGDAGKEKAAEKRLPEVEDGEEYGDANASEEELEEGKGFFACYLLTSLCPRHKGRTYIGFTVNPRRRIRQHNGEIRCGASRTKRGRPWEMTLCIYGFPSNVSALQEELLRAQLEATAKSKELSQAPWLATHANYYKELATTHWKEHGQPVLDVLLQKVSEKSIQAQQFMEPHFESFKAKWMFLVSSTEPYVQTVSSKAVEVYHTSKSAMSSHLAKVQEISDPYFQAAKRFSQPYVKQFATITKPHVEKVRVAFSPYSDCVIHAYGKFLESATTYHRQVQVGIQEHFKKYELIKFLATKELVWFMASTLLIFPVFLAYKLLSYILGSKKTKTTKSSHATRPHRKPKHRHAEK